MAQKDPIFELCDTVRETSFALHKFLRHGHKEKIYENKSLINFGSPILQIKKYALSRDLDRPI